jgi:hypothetical protein
VTEYRRRSPEPGEGGGGGLGEGRQQQHPRTAKAAKMDAMDEGAACLGPLFDAAGGESGGGRHGDEQGDCFQRKFLHNRAPFRIRYMKVRK